MRSIAHELIYLGLTETEADELIAELDHDDNGMNSGYTALGLRVKACIDAHRGFMKAVEGGDDDFIRMADDKMTDLYSNN